ncbi:uncharacterized protein LOC117188507 [Drosophila miranda]|uniref:uncharacterized protein LOC117188507 n=1 Tax=Drosophila miranda TaxID=7229 RepID=UPI00143F42DD|nr:uncharacterized protein LOC117188507 [Drosophila miranda]
MQNSDSSNILARPESSEQNRCKNSMGKIISITPRTQQPELGAPSLLMVTTGIVQARCNRARWLVVVRISVRPCRCPVRPRPLTVLPLPFGSRNKMFFSRPP